MAEQLKRYEADVLIGDGHRLLPVCLDADVLALEQRLAEAEGERDECVDLVGRFSKRHDNNVERIATLTRERDAAVGAVDRMRAYIQSRIHVLRGAECHCDLCEQARLALSASPSGEEKSERSPCPFCHAPRECACAERLPASEPKAVCGTCGNSRRVPTAITGPLDSPETHYESCPACTAKEPTNG